MVNWMARAKKAIVAVAGSAILLYVGATDDGVVTNEEWGLIAGALVVGALTYWVKNKPKAGDREPRV